MSTSSRTRYDEPFKQAVVALVVEQGDSVKEAAEQMGVPPHYVSRWKRKYPHPSSTQLLSCDERRELEQLRKENRRLRMERDILKKAAAFFSS